MGEISISAADRIIRKATGMRVSESAAKALVEILEEIGTNIAEKAGKLAKHARRKTVRAEDIKFAYEELYRK